MSANWVDPTGNRSFTVAARKLLLQQRVRDRAARVSKRFLVSNYLPDSTLAIPSYCAVCSPDKPTTKEQVGLAIRFGYFLLLLNVSKMISRSRVTAMPASADCGAPDEEIVESTPNLGCERKWCRCASVTNQCGRCSRCLDYRCLSRLGLCLRRSSTFSLCTCPYRAGPGLRLFSA